MITIDVEETKQDQINPFDDTSFTSTEMVDESSTDNMKNDINLYPKNNKNRKIGECSAYCNGLFYWLPLRQLCLIGVLALLILPFIQGLLFGPIPIEMLVLYAYVQFFSLIGIFMELPTFLFTRKIQSRIYFYFRFLRRLFGRAIFYITISIITFMDWTSFIFIAAAGLYLFFISFIMFIVSLMSANKLHLMYKYMCGESIDDNEIKESIKQHFEELNVNNNDKIGSKELNLFAEKVLNNKLSNAERHTIQLYLDCSCNGYISSEDWIKQFVNAKKVHFL